MEIEKMMCKNCFGTGKDEHWDERGSQTCLYCKGKGFYYCFIDDGKEIIIKVEN